MSEHPDADRDLNGQEAYSRRPKDPKTKEELLNRMLSYDFSGDLRDLGFKAQIERVDRHMVRIIFPYTGKTYELVVRMPRRKRGKRKPPTATVLEARARKAIAPARRPGRPKGSKNKPKP